MSVTEGAGKHVPCPAAAVPAGRACENVGARMNRVHAGEWLDGVHGTVAQPPTGENPSTRWRARFKRALGRNGRREQARARRRRTDLRAPSLSSRFNSGMGGFPLACRSWPHRPPSRSFRPWFTRCSRRGGEMLWNVHRPRHLQCCLRRSCPRRTDEEIGMRGGRGPPSGRRRAAFFLTSATGMVAAARRRMHSPRSTPASSRSPGTEGSRPPRRAAWSAGPRPAGAGAKTRRTSLGVDMSGQALEDAVSHEPMTLPAFAQAAVERLAPASGHGK